MAESYLTKLGKQLMQEPERKPLPKRDLSPSNRDREKEPEEFSGDTILMDVKPRYKRGGTVRGQGCARKGFRKAKLR
jgi:hypothetical protein